jgi:hypothetical protein
MTDQRARDDRLRLRRARRVAQLPSPRLREPGGCCGSRCARRLSRRLVRRSRDVSQEWQRPSPEPRPSPDGLTPRGRVRLPRLHRRRARRDRRRARGPLRAAARLRRRDRTPTRGMGFAVFELARVMGTSVRMIEKHYGTLLEGDHAGIATGSPRSRRSSSRRRGGGERRLGHYSRTAGAAGHVGRRENVQRAGRTRDGSDGTRTRDLRRG